MPRATVTAADSNDAPASRVGLRGEGDLGPDDTAFRGDELGELLPYEGGRGPTHVFDRLPGSISRRLVLVNGEHGTQTEEHVRKDRFAWMDYWLLGKVPDGTQPKPVATEEDGD